MFLSPLSSIIVVQLVFVCCLCFLVNFHLKKNSEVKRKEDKKLRPTSHHFFQKSNWDPPRGILLCFRLQWSESKFTVYSQVIGGFLLPRSTFLLLICFSGNSQKFINQLPRNDDTTLVVLIFLLQGEAPILWPPDVKSPLIRKDLDAGKDRRQEVKGRTEEEMVGWHHRINRHGFRWTPGVADGQGGLACCGSWGCKELNTTEWLNNNNNKLRYHHIESFYGWFSFDVILIIWRHIFHTYWDI